MDTAKGELYGTLLDKKNQPDRNGTLQSPKQMRENIAEIKNSLDEYRDFKK